MELYRALEEAEPDRYRADLASALANLGVALSNLGQERDARPAVTAAVELYRTGKGRTRATAPISPLP